MIKELHLKNWKSFEQATLYIDPLTLLIGSNAGGKSNTLDALLLLNRTSQGIALSSAIAGSVGLTPLRGGMDWVCYQSGEPFTLSILLADESNNREYSYELKIQVNHTRAEVCAERLILRQERPRGMPKETTLFRAEQHIPHAPSIRTYFWTGKQGKGKALDLGLTHTLLAQTESLNLRKEIHTGVQYVRRHLQRIFVFDPIPSHMRQYAALSDTLAMDGSNVAGVLAGLTKENKASVEDTLTHYLQALPEQDITRVWAETVDKFKRDAMLYCSEDWGQDAPYEMDARAMSDGSLRYLAIVVALLTLETGSLLVIEEVDNGLHPARAKTLLDMLCELGRKRQIDIIITTHNPALLDATGTSLVSYVTVVHRNSRGHSCLKLLEDINSLPKMMAGGTLGWLATGGQIESALKTEGCV